MRSIGNAIPGVLLGVVAWSGLSWAGGLSCSIGEVVIQNLKIGKSYSLIELVNLPLSITNTGTQTIALRVDPLVPQQGELRNGSEPIPDVAWASAEPDSLTLGPKEMRAVELRLTIPDDESLFGRQFQVQFWSHSLPRGGDMLAYGLSSRVIFTVDKTRDDPGASPSGDLSLTLVPAEITLERVRPGKKYKLENGAKDEFVVRSFSKDKISVELKALNAEESITALPEGYADLLSVATVELSPSTLTLAPGEEVRISATVTFPKGKKLAGRKFAGVVSARVTNMSVETQIYSRIIAHGL